MTFDKLVEKEGIIKAFLFCDKANYPPDLAEKISFPCLVELHYKSCITLNDGELTETVKRFIQEKKTAGSLAHLIEAVKQVSHFYGEASSIADELFEILENHIMNYKTASWEDFAEVYEQANHKGRQILVKKIRQLTK